MNTDIRISTSFLNHRKRKKLKYILGLEATDYLIDLWINTAINRPKGILYNMDKEDIAIDAGFDGKADYFVDVLLEVGFLDYDGEWFRIHDWPTHQAWAVNAGERSDQAKKAAKARWDAVSIEVGQCGQHTASIQPACGQDANSNTPILSSPLLSKPKKNIERFDARVFLSERKVKSQHISEWLKIRGKKKLQSTLTAFKAVEREAGKAKLSLPEAIEKCCEESWAGFKASWLVNRDSRSPTSKADQIQIEKEKKALGKNN